MNIAAYLNRMSDIPCVSIEKENNIMTEGFVVFVNNRGFLAQSRTQWTFVMTFSNAYVFPFCEHANNTVREVMPDEVLRHGYVVLQSVTE